MKCKFTILFFILFHTFTFAQTDFWQKANGPYCSGTIGTIAVDSRGVMYCGTASAGIFVSSDKGNSWVQKNSGLSNVFVNKIVV